MWKNNSGLRFRCTEPVLLGTIAKVLSRFEGRHYVKKSILKYINRFIYFNYVTKILNTVKESFITYTFYYVKIFL